MITWPAKDPDEVVGYAIDWSPLLGADEIDTYQLVVVRLGGHRVDHGRRRPPSAERHHQRRNRRETTTFTNTITTVGGFTYEETITLAVVSSQFPVGPSTTRKRVLIEMAVQELRLAGYEFNFSPEEYVASLRFLDGIAQLYPLSGYNQPAVFGEGEVDDASGLYDTDVADFAVMLAEAIAPMVGKTLSPTTIRRVSATRIRLNARYAVIPTVGLAPGTPTGSGRRRLTVSRGPFVDGSNA
jgi:hypothetical protein